MIPKANQQENYYHSVNGEQVVLLMLERKQEQLAKETKLKRKKHNGDFMLTKIIMQKVKNLLNWLINKFRKVNSNSVQFKLQQMEKERDMPGHYGKKGKGKSAKMKKQAATAIAMKKAGKKPKKKMR
tara:strand:+ start:1233 stop:1613 length:381 start_codon:yes stop_codon:yes gene_type:complete